MAKTNEEWKRAARVDWLIEMLSDAEDVMDVSPEWKKDYNASAVANLDDVKAPVWLFHEPDDEVNVDIYFPDADLKCLPKEWDASFMFLHKEYTQPGHFPVTITRARTIPIKKLRGVKIFGSPCVEVTQIGMEGRVEHGVKRVFSYNGKSWLKVTNTAYGVPSKAKALTGDYNRGHDRDVEDSGLIDFCVNIAFSQQYQWMVEFKNRSKRRGVRIPVHPFEIARLFKLREKTNQTRRKALKTWISGHWRKIDATEETDILTLVRDHLRGQLRFDWFGLQAEIIVPPKEVEFLSRLKAEREKMKLTVPRTDRKEVKQESFLD